MDAEEFITGEDNSIILRDEELNGLQRDLINRSAKAGLDCRKETGEDGEEYFSLQMPSGREKHAITLTSTNLSKRILSIPFEKYIFLSGFKLFVHIKME